MRLGLRMGIGQNVATSGSPPAGTAVIALADGTTSIALADGTTEIALAP